MSPTEFALRWSAKLSSPLVQTRVRSIQPELWVDEARRAVAFYEAAFGATTLHLVGEGEDIVAQLSVGDAAFWVAAASSPSGRFDPLIDSVGQCSRMSLESFDAHLGPTTQPRYR
jgi:hypothetical protein